MPPHVSIVVVSYNGEKDTMECLKSISDLTYDNVDTILVDQNSKDGTVQAVKQHYPWVRLIKNHQNDGITGGNNIGLKEALAHSTDYILLLNNDTIIEPSLLQKLVDALENDRSIGIASPTAFYYNRPDVICYAGIKIDCRGQNYGTEGISINSLDMNIRETDLAAGGAVIIRKSVIEQIGLMDNRFFIYFDDTDFCARARQAGWKIMYIPTAKIWHKISHTSEALGNHFGVYHWRRNRLLYLWKNGKPRLLCCLWCILGDTRTLLQLFLTGHKAHAMVMIRALKDSLTGRWGSTFFSYKNWVK